MQRLALFSCCLIARASAHGHLTTPVPRPSSWAPGKEQGATSPAATYRYDQPTHSLDGGMTHEAHTYGDTSFRCHDFAASTPTTTITAGATLDLAWELPANHPGDCALYISYETDKVAPERWVKLHDFIGCVSKSDLPTFTGPAPNTANTYQITLPDWLPSSDHAVLRWEWHSVQQVTNVEFYTTCVDVIVSGTGDSADTFYSKASPVVSITGTSHMPADASSYRKAYDGQVGAEYLVGPAVATYDGVPADGGGDGDVGEAVPARPPSPPGAPTPPVAPGGGGASSLGAGGAGALGAFIGFGVGTIFGAVMALYCRGGGRGSKAPPPPPPPSQYPGGNNKEMQIGVMPGSGDATYALRPSV